MSHLISNCLVFYWSKTWNLVLKMNSAFLEAFKCMFQLGLFLFCLLFVCCFCFWWVFGGWVVGMDMFFGGDGGLACRKGYSWEIAFLLCSSNWQPTWKNWLSATSSLYYSLPLSFFISSMKFWAGREPFWLFYMYLFAKFIPLFPLKLKLRVCGSLFPHD